jgi:hypothetical protein
MFGSADLKTRIMAGFLGKLHTMIISADNESEAASPFGETAAVLENAEAAKAFIVSEGARLCASAVGDKARAIVLTGSVSRNEATLRKDGLGWRAMGDATFLVIFDGSANINTTRIESRIEKYLISQGVICKVVVVTSTASGLSRMKPHIYAYELRQRGVVVWGDQSVLDLMPRFTAADIPMEDGWWFLCNRIIEQLETAAKANQNDHTDAGVRYRIAKLYLSMAACYLLTIGQYEPSYRERAQRLRELSVSSNPQPSPIPLQRFSQHVSECTSLKIQGETTGAFGQLPQWRNAVSDAESLWRWTLSRILGGELSSSRSDLLAILAKRQPMLARAKGWVRAAVKHPGRFFRNWFRWARLACTASPRYLVYGAAGDLFFGSQESDALTPDQLLAITSKLPLSRCNAGQQLSWHAVAMMIADNFHGLLESTRS